MGRRIGANSLVQWRERAERPRDRDRMCNACNWGRICIVIIIHIINRFIYVDWINSFKRARINSDTIVEWRCWWCGGMCRVLCVQKQRIRHTLRSVYEFSVCVCASAFFAFGIAIRNAWVCVCVCCLPSHELISLWFSVFIFMRIWHLRLSNFYI